MRASRLAARAAVTSRCAAADPRSTNSVSAATWRRQKPISAAIRPRRPRTRCNSFFRARHAPPRTGRASQRVEEPMFEMQATLLANKALLSYVFGVIIIILYAKDKFNTPTYDR